MNEITTVEELEEALRQTENEPAFFYKHSTRCPISRGAHRRILMYLDQRDESDEVGPPFHLVNVIESRPVSKAVADKLEVPHQSPQLILVEGGKSVWNTSHHNITGENIDKAVAEHAA